MIVNLFFLVLALLGITFLIFIHELGHYLMALKTGMKVEVFSIGFGKSIYEWERKGVKWKIGWIPFGGYVRIAGMEKKGSIEPYQIPDGYFSKSPWARIKVAVMGPLFNLIFALVIFTVLWALGGRHMSFARFTHYVGWIENASPIYQEGLRPGDQILKVNDRSFEGYEEFFQDIVLSPSHIALEGVNRDYFQQKVTPFTYSLTRPNTDDENSLLAFFKSFSPASYLFFNHAQEGAPILNSGIQLNDRIIWVDGELIFSVQQLVDVMNKPRSLLTVKREQSTFLTRVPRLQITDLQLNQEEIAELEDWKYESQLTPKVQQLYFIPYKINAQAVVEGPVSYINEKSELTAEFTKEDRIASGISLQTGDRILAIDGMPIQSSYELFQKIQAKHLQIIVQSHESTLMDSWKDADEHFDLFPLIDDLKKLLAGIGTESSLKEAGTLRLLKPVAPVPLNQLQLSDLEKTNLQKRIQQQKDALEKIPDLEKKALALKELEQSQKRLSLGAQFQDGKVSYNPDPITLFGNVIDSIWRTLGALFSGVVSPKQLGGPVAVVQIIQQGWSNGLNDALYWLGMISINLGILNLLPVPVLDGGHICFSIVEMITKKPIKAKTMERWIIPFVVLLIALFIYLTYNDLIRLFHRFF